jgi:hypothetical protein
MDGVARNSQPVEDLRVVLQRLLSRARESEESTGPRSWLANAVGEQMKSRAF